ncbi:MAG TPA: phosphodiesterase, partial [Oceanospirillales bacterium]|nr:phosphodiesterase [Oceanospirillales bacterium]
MEMELPLYSFDHEGSIQFIQITDTHLVEAENGHLLGLETLHSLECVLNSVKAENSLFDFFVMSGDLSQDGSLRSYQRLKAALLPFKVPSFWFAGNHDCMENMQAVCQDTEHFNNVIRT